MRNAKCSRIIVFGNPVRDILGLMIKQASGGGSAIDQGRGERKGTQSVLCTVHTSIRGLSKKTEKYRESRKQIKNEGKKQA